MLRLTALAILLLAPIPLAASSPAVKVQTVVVTPKIVTESPAPARTHTLHAKTRRVRTHAARTRGLLHARHTPRPLSPGEFGRVRASY